MKYILISISLLLSGCALFQKTTKTKDVTKRSSNSQLKYDQLVLKHADKETQIYTYWTDSGFYQFQQIKEQMNQAQSDQVRAVELHNAKHTAVEKKAKPVYLWGVVIVIISLLLFRTYRKLTL